MGLDLLIIEKKLSTVERHEPLSILVRDTNQGSQDWRLLREYWTSQYTESSSSASIRCCAAYSLREAQTNKHADFMALSIVLRQSSVSAWNEGNSRRLHAAYLNLSLLYPAIRCCFLFAVAKVTFIPPWASRLQYCASSRWPSATWLIFDSFLTTHWPSAYRSVRTVRGGAVKVQVYSPKIVNSVLIGQFKQKPPESC